MNNRAKCKLCLSIIESYHSTDYVECKCGEISVDGGPAMRCAAKNWNNFLRVDDEGNEIVPAIKDGTKDIDVKPLYNGEKPTRNELIGMLDEMIKNVERMPQNAMSESISHYDYSSLMMILAQIFKAEK